MTRGRTIALSAAAIALGLVLRVVWPLADPPRGLTWSNGVYTDPASVTHAARNHALFGEWVRDDSRDLVFYPLANGVTRVAYGLFGVSRLVTQILSALLGTAAVAALALAVGRAKGRPAGALAALLGATCPFLGFFARVPLVENLTGLLLAGSAALALGRGGGHAAAAAFVAGVAALFGKLHAISFLPGLALFLVLRARSVRPLLPLAGGFALAGLPWLAFVFLPHREAFGAQLAASGSLYGAEGLGAALLGAPVELLRTVRTSWLFPRIPILGALGVLFVIGTFVSRDSRRERLEDGSALFALWFAAVWIYHALLPYQAPRYYVLAALPLVGAAVAWLGELAGRGRLEIRRPQGTGAWARAGIGLFAVSFVGVDVARHGLGAAAELFGVPHSRLFVETQVTLDRLALPLYRLPIALLVAGSVSLAGFASFALLSRSTTVRSRAGNVAPRSLAKALVAASVAFHLATWASFASHRQFAIEDAKRAIASILPGNAVLLGSFAPLVVQDGRLVGIPQFGGPERHAITRFGVSHVLLGEPGDPVPFERAYPGLAGSMIEIREWPLRTRHVRALRLDRLPDATERAGVALGPFEEGAIRMAAGRFDEAVERFRAFRGAAGPGGLRTPGRTGGPGASGAGVASGAAADALSLEARCLYLQGRPDDAIESLREALRIRPTHPGDHFNLGNLLLRRGEEHEARRLWERGLALDPHDATMWSALRDLNARGGAVAGGKGT